MGVNFPYPRVRMVRIGLWGTFDIEHLGDMLFPRVLRAELERRVPGLEVRPLAPIGYVGLNRFEGDTEPAGPLGTWGEQRLDELAQELDAVVIGGGEIAHGDDARMAPWYGLPPQELVRRQPSRFFIEGLGSREIDVPTAWHAIGVAEPSSPELGARWGEALAGRALVSVRDEPSRQHLEQAGVSSEVAVVPDPAYLMPRLLPPDVLADRVDRLRAQGAYPDGDALVVQGAGSLAGEVGPIAEQVEALCRAHGLTPVIVEAEPVHGDRAFADALEARLPRAVRLPASAGADDVIAAIAWSAGAVASSRVVSVLAAAYGRPIVTLNLDRRPGPEAVAARAGAVERVAHDPSDIVAAYERTRDRGSISQVVEGLVAELDDHLDRVAALATSIEVHPGEPPVIAGSTLPDERERYAVATRSLAARMAAMQSAFAERERDLVGYLDAQAREIVEKDVRFTKLWRKIHEGDRHYHWHYRRADEAEELNEQLRGEIARLRAYRGLHGGRGRRWARGALIRLRPTWLGRGLASLRGKARPSGAGRGAGR